MRGAAFDSPQCCSGSLWLRLLLSPRPCQLYIRQEFPECLKVIEAQLQECKGLAEYPLYVKALIRRQQGAIAESLQLFQAATVLNPHNVANLKQVGRSLYLSGKHKQAIDVYEEAQRIGIDDWEVWHNKGLCHLYLKSYAQACDDFKAANAIQRHDSTYMQLGKVYTLQENYEAAIEVYLEALESAHACEQKASVSHAACLLSVMLTAHLAALVQIFSRES